jgi:hypothetical protein
MCVHVSGMCGYSRQLMAAEEAVQPNENIV